MIYCSTWLKVTMLLLVLTSTYSSFNCVLGSLYDDNYSSSGEVLNKAKPILLLKSRFVGGPLEESISYTKKSCSVRLGGLCLTESLDAAVNQYEYLRSGHSPGRKRRTSSKLLPF